MYIICILLLAGSVLLILYARSARKRWLAVLGKAMDYHRHHLAMLQGDPAMGDRSRECVRAMFWALTKQVPADRSAGALGLTAFVKSYMTGATALGILGGVFFSVWRYRAVIDEVVIRLLNTLTSTLYRYYLLHSRLAVVLLLSMDVKLLLAFAGILKSGPARMFRDLTLEHYKQNE